MLDWNALILQCYHIRYLRITKKSQYFCNIDEKMLYSRISPAWCKEGDK
jgi:hypothetical protein